MTTIRRFHTNDLPGVAALDLEYKDQPFSYLHMAAKWSDYFLVAKDPRYRIIGYISGICKGVGEARHATVAAFSVEAKYRRENNVATQLMNRFDLVAEADKAFFVNVYVRDSSKEAKVMFENVGFVKYRTERQCYTEEDGIQMRKPLSRDTGRKSMVNVDRQLKPEPEPEPEIHPDHLARISRGAEACSSGGYVSE